MRRILAVLLLVVLLTPFSAPAAFAGDDPSCSWCDAQGETPRTGGDQENGAVVTTGVQFPGVDSDSALGRATAEYSNCSGCEWTMSPACVANGPTDTEACAGATQACTAPAIRYRIFFRPNAGAPWQLIQTICLDPGDRPTSVADIGEKVREVVVNYLPDASPSFQPAQGGVVNLPTIFAANEPESITTESFDVLGFQVVVTATARWEWTFDDGVTEEFTKPGGRYPDDSVSWTYDEAGARDVSLITYWKASFTVDGEGPFAVPGPEISKTAGPLTVPVREARSVLVGG